MADAQFHNVTRLNPRLKSPLWWRLSRWLFLLLALLIALHFGWGMVEKRKLARTVAEYRREGEPILPEDFDQPAIPDADNAVIELRAAAATIDDARFTELGDLKPQLPLTERETSVIRRALANFPASSAESVGKFRLR